MATTTPNLGLVLTPDGATNWGTDQRNNLSTIDTFAGTTEKTANKGLANGYASLDNTASVPAAQLANVPDALAGASISVGNVNATTLTITDTTGANPDLVMQSSATATSAGPVWSPILEFIGSYWSGSAPSADIWQIGSQIGAGTNGASTLVFQHYGTPSSSSAIVLSTTANKWVLNLNGNVTTYNGDATAGVGAPYIKGSRVAKAETGADANLLTVTQASGAIYRVSIVLSVSAASAATLGWTATWVDSNGTAQAPTNLALTQAGALPALTFSAAPGATYHGSMVCDAGTGSLVIKTTFTGTSIAYKASAIVERLN